MPLYEYVCRRCAREFEELVFGQASPVCPGCGGAEVERVLSVVSVARAEPPVAAGPCGSCGDPRGPGACARN